MISFKCKNCGGEMAVSRIGDLACPYCASRNFFSDRELQEYRTFRMRMLEYLRALAEEGESSRGLERLWDDAETCVFRAKDGTDITIQYIYKSMEDGIWLYSARKNVIYIYPKDKIWMADKSTDAFQSIAYPQADMKGLDRCFPTLAGRYELEDESIMLVYSKDENMYPLAMFGSLPAKHVEWIISRLENIACVLTFNEMEHGAMTTESVFINPLTHEAALLGGWYNSKTAVGATVKDLQDIRKVAEKMLGENYGDAPKPLISFIKKKPAKSAYDDFAMWDRVIEEELGGRHFTKFEI